MKKYLIIPAVALTLAAGAVYFQGQTFAQAQNGQYPPVVEKIAQKFNLNVTEVQAVFDEQRTEREAQHQANMLERLNQLVTEGKLTEAQKQAVIAKHEEMRAAHQQHREAGQNMTPEERKTEMEAKRTELEAWAQQNGISPELLKELFHPGKMGPGGRHGGPRGGFRGEPMNMHNVRSS